VGAAGEGLLDHVRIVMRNVEATPGDLARFASGMRAGVPSARRHGRRAPADGPPRYASHREICGAACAWTMFDLRKLDGLLEGRFCPRDALADYIITRVQL